VLVTLESAVTKTFNTYINRLQSTYQLDRVVIDECHVVLDSGPDFRPKLRALGAEIVQWKTQMIFLTATLLPKDDEFFYPVFPAHNRVGYVAASGQHSPDSGSSLTPPAVEALPAAAALQPPT
jgi:hypothetical protein